MLGTELFVTGASQFCADLVNSLASFAALGVGFHL